jgi:hypothetical protein
MNSDTRSAADASQSTHAIAARQARSARDRARHGGHRRAACGCADVLAQLVHDVGELLV